MQILALGAGTSPVTHAHPFQMESWNASLGRQGNRAPPEFQGSQG